MKKQTKILLTLLLSASLIFTLFAVTSSAQYSEKAATRAEFSGASGEITGSVADGTTGGAGLAASNDGTAGGAGLTASNDGTAGGVGLAASNDGTAGGAGLAASNDSESDNNIFTIIYNYIGKYLSEILSTLTFGASLILALTYKRGLVPYLETSILQIAVSAKKAREKTEKSEVDIAALRDMVGYKLGSLETAVNTYTEKLAELAKELEKVKEGVGHDKESDEQIKFVMETQVEMLNDIFMSSALPQYQKDMVGRRVTKMRGCLADDEK